MCILFTYRPPNPLLLCMLHAAANSYAAIGHVARVLVYISRLPLTDWVCPGGFIQHLTCFIRRLYLRRE
jgi:hypothetical protein